jgi:hypothetical protein
MPARTAYFLVIEMGTAVSVELSRRTPCSGIDAGPPGGPVATMELDREVEDPLFHLVRQHVAAEASSGSGVRDPAFTAVRAIRKPEITRPYCAHLRRH